MTAVITSMCPSSLIFATPLQIFRHFISTIKSEMKIHQITKKQCQKFRGAYEKLQAQNHNVKVQVQAKMKQVETKVCQWTQEKERLNKEIILQKQRTQNLKKQAQQNKRQLNELKIQKLKLIQQKNKEFQEIMRFHRTQEFNIKNQLQKENLKIQKNLKAELQSKNLILKQMSAFIQKMKAFSNNQIKETEVIQQFFKRLQKLNDLSQIIIEVRTQNAALRSDKNALQTSRLKLQTKIKQLKLVQSNLLCKLQRSQIEIQQLQDKLMKRTNQILKSEKEKEELDKYYTQRWNNQYKRVKSRFDNDLTRKIATIQQQLALKRAQLQIFVQMKDKQNRALIERNALLEEININSRNKVNQLQQHAQTLNQYINQLKSNINEAQFMNLQDNFMKRYIFNQKKIVYERKIAQLHGFIKSLEEKMIFLKQQHFKQIQQLQKKLALQLYKQKKEHENDKIVLINTHTEQILKFKQLIQKKQRFILQKQIQFQHKYKKKLQTKELEFNQKVAEKEQEYIRKQQKWSDRYKEQEIVSLITKKKLEEEILKLKLQIDKLQEKDRQLTETFQQMKNKVQEISKQNKSFRQKIFYFQKQIREKKLVIAELQLRNQKLLSQLISSRREVDTLFELRKQWQKQLVNLEEQFKQQISILKRSTQKQRKLLQQKITQLQDINNRKMMIEREYKEFELVNRKKEQLEQQIDAKQAQNKLLIKVKDYYQVKLKQAEKQISKQKLNLTHSIMNQKAKKSRIRQDRQYCSSKKMLDQLPQSNQMGKTKRYTIYSYRKHFNFSTSKQRLQQSTHIKPFRLKTSYYS